MNGVAITVPSAGPGDGSCVDQDVLTFNLALSLGTNVLKVKACDAATAYTIMCDSATQNYTYATPDPVKPSGSTTSATTATSPYIVSVRWCDDYKINTATPQFWLNDSTITGISTQSPAGPCYSWAESSATVSLRVGSNALKAVVRDSAGNVSDTVRTTITYNPNVVTVSKVGEDRVRRPGLCAVSCFDATLGYSTHTFTTMDTPQGAGLVYSSAHAEPRGLVQFDVNTGSAPVPTRIGLSLKNLAGATVPLMGPRNQTTVWYTGAAGTNRVSAWFDASTLQTGTYLYKAQITRMYGTTPQYDSMNVRVIVVNQINSPYGAGWSLAEDAKVVLPTGNMDPSGVTVVAGDGTATFFTAPASCGTTGNCTYISPSGEFNTLTRDGTGYRLTSSTGDVTRFDLTGKLAARVDRFDIGRNYYYFTSACGWCYVGSLSTIDPSGADAIYPGYDPATGRMGSFYILGTYVGTYYDTNGNLIRIDDADGVTALSVTYSGRRMTGYTDRAGNHTDIQYDSAGKVAMVIGPAYRAQGSTGWRDTTRIVSYERAVLPAPGAPATDLSPAAAVSPATTYAWVIGTRNDSTRLHLDSWRAADQVRDPRGYTTSSVRNSDGLTTSTTDAKGNSVGMTWNGSWLMQVTDPNGTVQYEYDTNGRVKREYGNTPETKYFYSSGSAWVTDSVHVDGQGTIRFTYDIYGRMLTQSDSASHTTSVVYEPTGWMNTKQVTEPGSRTTTYGGWDTFGRATQVTGPDAGVSQVTFDVLGRVTTATAPNTGVVRYYYGAVQLDSLKDQRNQVFRWTRNQLGWVESETRPDDGSVHRTAVYDRYGRVVSSSDRRGSSGTVSYGYDTRDRMTMMVVGTDTTRWTYSPDQPGVTTAPTWVWVRNSFSADSLHYDTRGRLARSVTVRNMLGSTRAYEVAYTFNDRGAVDTLKYRINGGAWEWSRFGMNASTGQLTSIRDFSGRTTTLSYNGEGALKQISSPNTQVGSLSYTSTHQLSQIGYASIPLAAAATVGFSYDSENRISRQSYNRNRSFRDYTYDTTGRLTSQTDLVRSTVHPSCQLIEDQGYVCNTDGQFAQTFQRTYTYDLTDNPTDKGALIGAGNRLTGYDGWTMTYDLEGNLTGKSKTGSPTYGYTWDAAGRLTSVQVNGSTVATYGYDGLGRRVYRNSSGGPQYFIYQGDQLLLEANSWSTTPAEEYTYVPGSDAPFALRHGGIPYWFHTDPQGSVLAITDQYGAVANQYRYSPFGAADSLYESFGNRIRHAGREWDADAGLYYNRARWYDPQLQRFISHDPIGLDGGLNLYTYVSNDPVNGADPSGLMDCRKQGATVQGTTVWTNPCGDWGMPAWMLMDVRAFMARQCEPWRCSQQGLPGLCPAIPACNETLHLPSPRQREQFQNLLKNVSDQGYCGEAKREAQAVLAAGRVRIFTYALYDGGAKVFGEAPQLYSPDGRQILGRMMYLAVGSINLPTILHEAMHGVPLPGAPYGSNHLDRVPLPGIGRRFGRSGEPTMEDAAFLCAGQKPPTW